MANIHFNDIGTVFKVLIIDDATGAAMDVSGASTKQILFGKPEGTTTPQPAAFTTDGTDGYIQYTTVNGDLDEYGTWKIQGFVVGAAYSNHSEIDRFRVRKNL